MTTQSEPTKQITVARRRRKKSEPPLTPAPLNEPALRSMPVARLRTGRYQPRLRIDERCEDFRQLVASVRARGIVSPLIVAQGENTDSFDVLSGERRLRAARAVGLDQVPVREMADLDDADKDEIALVENLLRSDLSAYEVALRFKRLIDERGISQQALAERLGTTQARISMQLQILDAPEWLQQFVQKQRIGYSVAVLFTRLLRRSSEKKVLAVAEAFKQGEIGRSDLRRLLKERSSRKASSGADEDRRFMDLVTLDDGKHLVRLRGFTVSRKGGLTRDQARQIVKQLEGMIAMVKEIAETGEL